MNLRKTIRRAVVVSVCLPFDGSGRDAHGGPLHHFGLQHAPQFADARRLLGPQLDDGTAAVVTPRHQAAALQFQQSFPDRDRTDAEALNQFAFHQALTRVKVAADDLTL